MVKMRLHRWPLIQRDWGPYKKRPGCRHTQRDNYVRTWGEDSVYKPRREASGGTSPARTLTLDFQPPGCEEVEICCSSLPAGVFVTQL